MSVKIHTDGSSVCGGIREWNKANHVSGRKTNEIVDWATFRCFPYCGSPIQSGWRCFWKLKEFVGQAANVKKIGSGWIIGSSRNQLKRCGNFNAIGSSRYLPLGFVNPCVELGVRKPASGSPRIIDKGSG